MGNVRGRSESRAAGTAVRLVTGAGIRERGVGGNLRATEASSTCQVQAGTQGRTRFMPTV